MILFNLSGHGNFDMGAYEAYLGGKLEDFEYPAEAVKEAMEKLPKVELTAQRLFVTHRRRNKRCLLLQKDISSSDS